MTTAELYSKAFDSDLSEDWQAYYAALREKMRNRKDHVCLDRKQDISLSDDEWEDMQGGIEMNPYAAHWWGW